MKDYRVIKIKENVLAKNEKEAEQVRKELKEHRCFFINLMSSPGSGKTTLLCNIIPKLVAKGYKVGVLEADIDGECDAETIVDKTGAKAIQVHTSGACHLTAQMAKESMLDFGLDGIDVLFLENIGNLVCPAEFDTGANLNMMLLSVPEGDDKPLKYPLMFQVSNLAVITKIDALPVFNFSMDRVREYIGRRHPDMPIFPVSAKKDIGTDELVDFIADKIEKDLEK